jgi:hypothetical protein
MGARRRRAHRELVGLDEAAPADEEFAPRSARAPSSAHARARGRARAKESQREFAILVGGFACVLALVVFVFYERAIHGAV